MSLGMNVPVIIAATLGFGRDMWGIAPDNITESLKYLYVAYFMYMIAECLCQLSILAFYLRIMVDPKLRIIVWTLLGMVVCFGIANTLCMIFQCTPIPFFWDGWRGEMDGFCGVDVRLFGFVRGAVEIFLDLAILILPLPMLAKLKMSSKKKLQIMSMFCVGFIITVVSCLRLWSFVQFAATQNPTCKCRIAAVYHLCSVTDCMPDDNVSGLYWCATESNLFTVVACMPAMHAIAHKMLRRVRNATGYGKSQYGSKGQYGSSGPSKGSYIRQTSGGREPKGPMNLGSITKSTNVDIYRTERSGSDVELVDHPAHV
jgi:hypothetical protein